MFEVFFFVKKNISLLLKISRNYCFLEFTKLNKGIWICIKKRLMCRCFPVNFAKFLRTPFLQNTSIRLLLFVINAKWPNFFLITKIFVQNTDIWSFYVFRKLPYRCAGELLRLCNWLLESPEVFCKKSCSSKFHSIQRRTPLLNSLFNKKEAWGPATSLKRDSNIGVFLWILRDL